MSNGVVISDHAPIDAMPTGIDRDSVAALVKANVKQILADALGDKLGHAYAVACGQFHFREAFMREMGAFFQGNRAQGDHLANLMFGFLQEQWRTHYPYSAGEFLDAVHVETPLSERQQEQEIEDAWEINIASDERSMQQHYYGSARYRKGRDAFSTFWTKPPQQ
jgi:hypothetical protein